MENGAQKNLNKSSVSVAFLVPVMIEKSQTQKPIKKINEEFTYIDYPGINFGKSKPFMQSNKITVTSCNMESESSSKYCSCKPSRSVSFYDLFLARNSKVTAADFNEKNHGKPQKEASIENVEALLNKDITNQENVNQALMSPERDRCDRCNVSDLDSKLKFKLVLSKSEDKCNTQKTILL
ncbi:uncharacterized protein LOC136091485 [Hydra vulgaris]|uniref:Uncharacterized protein LOC136091485 n=1 Tax=Hydra vulgaris TaxID=6087 RepID=A0ABM4DKX2_HYDVU